MQFFNKNRYNVINRGQPRGPAGRADLGGW
jgi:hypothetical protein